MSDYRSFRDDYTAKIVRQLGVRTNNGVYPDLAFSLDVDHLRQPVSVMDRRRCIAISPIAASALTSGDDHTYKEYLHMMSFLAGLAVFHGYKVVLFSSQTRTDKPIVQNLKIDIENACSPNVTKGIEVAASDSLDNLLRLMASVDMVVATRLHGVLLALVMHKPVLAISYSRKVTDLMNVMDLPQYCIDLDNLEKSALEKKFRLLESDMENVKREVAVRVRKFGDELDRQYRGVLSLINEGSNFVAGVSINDALQ
jgi:polysaccharide pyruvyl transferase WcaK-like protein